MILKDLLKFINNKNLSERLVSAKNETIEVTEIKFEMSIDNWTYTYHINLRTGMCNVTYSVL